MACWNLIAKGKWIKILGTAAACLFTLADSLEAATSTLFCAKKDAAAMFGAGDLSAAMARQGYTVSDVQDLTTLTGGTENIRIVLAKKGTSSVEDALAKEGAPPVPTLQPQGYAYRLTTSGTRRTYWVIGADATGLMYGGLDLANSIAINDLGSVFNSEHNPYIVRRGLLYNIPLDCRAPNYGASGDAFSENIEVMWDFTFWKEFLDDLARDHLNVIYLWTQNPFPVLVKVPDYPEVSLSDVQRPTIPFTGSTSGTGLTPPEMLKTAATVKTMTIEDKIAFWQKVMAYAHDRGVSFSLNTFNIHLYSMEGKHGITNSLSNPNTKDYFRKAVEAMVLTYPFLEEIGTYQGEDMKGSDEARQAWIHDTYYQGILDAEAQRPGRRVNFMDRVSSPKQMDVAASTSGADPERFHASIRYATQIYTTPTPHSFDFLLSHVPNGRQVWLEFRNESFFAFRFGDCEFIRSLIKGIPTNKTYGFLWGSNGYMYGREFISTDPDSPRQSLSKKMWYNFMLLGRLAYDPGLSTSLFQKTIANKFPEVSGPALYDAWVAASKIIPVVNRFHFSNTGGADWMWYPEACMNQRENTISNFIGSRTIDSTMMNIGAYRDKLAGGLAMGSAITPLQTAQQLNDYADAALQSVDQMDPGPNKELRLTIGDIRAMAYLGYYYSEKIQGATEKAIYDQDPASHAEFKQKAIDHLRLAAMHWRTYAAAFAQLYKPQWLSRIGPGGGSASAYVDVKQLFATALTDLKIARGSDLDASTTPTANGSILEAEKARFRAGLVTTRLSGFTGTGAVEFTRATNGTIEWNYFAAQPGSYSLEFRYSMASGNVPATLSLNGKQVDGELSFWTTGNSWQSETRHLPLVSGPNVIKLSFRTPRTLLVDHLNVVASCERVLAPPQKR